jgi:hypothetical protein
MGIKALLIHALVQNVEIIDTHDPVFCRPAEFANRVMILVSGRDYHQPGLERKEKVRGPSDENTLLVGLHHDRACISVPGKGKGEGNQCNQQ